jgi:gamma-glutamyl hydrolase
MSTVRHLTLKKSRSCSVGILITPHQAKAKHGTSHIMKAYVDWFEDRGIHVVPIPYDIKDCDAIFDMISGLLIPGGETSYLLRHRAYMRTVTRFVQLAVRSGVHFPIWGTCFGMEVLLSVIGGFTSFSPSIAHRLTPIRLTKAADRSRMFRKCPKDIREQLETTPSTQQNHEFGMSPEEFKNNTHLTRFYHVLATGVDEGGKEYIAAIEAKHFPIYGVMWHPERQTDSPFGHYFADFFVSELRRNKKTASQGRLCIPPLRSMMAAHRCTHYPELGRQLCYFFRL